MAKSRSSKEQSVSLVIAMMKNAKSAVLVDFTGLKVKEMQELRQNLRASGITYEVVKKSLLKRSLESAGVKNFNEASLTGVSVSVATSSQDEVEPARVLLNFVQTHDKLKVLGGFLDKEFILASQVQILSKLAGRREMLGQFVSVLAAPLRGFASVMQGNLRGLVQVLRAVRDKKLSSS